MKQRSEKNETNKNRKDIEFDKKKIHFYVKQYIQKQSNDFNILSFIIILYGKKITQFYNKETI